MDIATWITFIFVSGLLLITPGPITLLAASYAINHGRARALPIVFGAVLGDFVAITISLLSIAGLVFQNLVFFIALKICGGLILIALGLKIVVTANKPQRSISTDVNGSDKRIFWSGFTLALLHPSGFVFFTSFLPQFIDPNHSIVIQSGALIVTFLFLSAISLMCWVFLASRIHMWITNEQLLSKVKQLSGLMLVVLGVVALVIIFWERGR